MMNESTPFNGQKTSCWDNLSTKFFYGITGLIGLGGGSFIAAKFRSDSASDWVGLTMSVVVVAGAAFGLYKSFCSKTKSEPRKIEQQPFLSPQEDNLEDIKAKVRTIAALLYAQEEMNTLNMFSASGTTKDVILTQLESFKVKLQSNKQSISISPHCESCENLKGQLELAIFLKDECINKFEQYSKMLGDGSTSESRDQTPSKPLYTNNSNTKVIPINYNQDNIEDSDQDNTETLSFT